MKTKPTAIKGTDPNKNREELKTDRPLSEKDELKAAENHTA